MESSDTMEIIKYYDTGWKDEDKEYKLYKVMSTKDVIKEFYKVVENKEDEKERLKETLINLNKQLEEQQQIIQINSNSIMEVYEIILNEGGEINE